MVLTATGADVAGADASGVFVHRVDSTYCQPEDPGGFERMQPFH